MGLDWVSGLLRGVEGTANAVNEISKEERHKIAEKSLMEAQAILDEAAQNRRYSQEKSLQKTDIAARKSESEADIASREKISGARIESAEKVAKMEADLKAKELSLKEKILGSDKKSTEAQNLRNKILAYTEARKILEGGGSTDEANAVLITAGLTPYEEYIAEEGSEGFFGTRFGRKPPVIGRRMAGAEPAGAAPVQPSGLKGELASLLNEGKKVMSGSRKRESEKPMVAEGPEQKPEPKGLISTAAAVKIPQRKMDIGDPSGWDVRYQNGQYFLMTKDGPRKMTEDEVAQWKASMGK